MTYRCGHCKQQKPAEEFSPSQRQNGKWCRRCTRDDYRSRCPALPPRPCESCGTVIPVPLPKSRFCSNECKNRARVKVDSARRIAMKATRMCERCGASIAHRTAYARWCGDECATRSRVHDPGKRRERLLMDKYGMTRAEFNDLLASQHGSCAICGTKDPRGHGWHVDHCHSGGQVRGILCSPCNTGLGQFQDDAARLRAALRYLARSQK